jgi:ABC-type glycerol-3-phosphate transport system substrate-binding protein
MSLGHAIKLSRRTFLRGTLGTVALATALAIWAPTVLTAAEHVLPLGEARFTQKFQGARLNVLMIDFTLSFEIKKRLPEFERMTGISVNIEISPYNAYHPKAMLPLASGASTYDVMMVDVPWVAEFVGTNNLLPLDDFVAKEDPFYFEDMVPELINVMNGSQDKLYSIATLPSTQLLSYRKDVFEQEAANYLAATGKELTVPTTWRECGRGEVLHEAAESGLADGLRRDHDRNNRQRRVEHVPAGPVGHGRTRVRQRFQRHHQ